MDQMEMMLMMQMDKLPEFSGSYSDVSEIEEQKSYGFNKAEIPTSGFSNASIDNCTNISIMQHFMEKPHENSTSLSFSGTHSVQEQPAPPFLSELSQKKNSMAAMREMIFRIAAMQPIHIDPKSIKPPKRKNVKISKDPQSVAARHRRERISERIRILQRLVPGGTKMDTASMLDEAIHYVKFLKSQVQSLERAAANRASSGLGFPIAMSSGSYLPLAKVHQPCLNVRQYYGDS